MMTIIPYDNKYDNEIKAFDRDIYLEVRKHKDVLKETVILSVDERDRLSGIGYLLASQSYRLLEERQLPEYFLHAIFRGFGENEAEASILLLRRLIELFNELSRVHEGKKLKLRLWCKESDAAYRELLAENGFKPINIMLVMKRNLSDRLPSFKEMFGKVSKSGIKLMIQKATLDECFFNEYIGANEESFGLPDSLDDLRFKLSNYNGAVYVAFIDKKLIASVTVWGIGTDTFSTENIFCRPSFQNRGITKALLGYVLYELKKTGASHAALTVYKNDLPAVRLYSSLGYMQMHSLFEMCYESDSLIETIG